MYILAPRRREICRVWLFCYSLFYTYIHYISMPRMIPDNSNEVTLTPAYVRLWKRYPNHIYTC